jgi:hypothetical protein
MGDYRRQFKKKLLSNFKHSLWEKNHRIDGNPVACPPALLRKNQFPCEKLETFSSFIIFIQTKTTIL